MNEKLSSYLKKKHEGYIKIVKESFEKIASELMYRVDEDLLKEIQVHDKKGFFVSKLYFVGSHILKYVNESEKAG